MCKASQSLTLVYSSRHYYLGENDYQLTLEANMKKIEGYKLVLNILNCKVIV